MVGMATRMVHGIKTVTIEYTDKRSGKRVTKTVKGFQGRSTYVRMMNEGKEPRVVTAER